MPERLRKIAAGAGVLLGTVHLIYGIIASKALTPELIWFQGAGVAMICVGLANWHRPARLQAGIMTAYLIAMVVILPLLQVFIGLAIFATLTFLPQPKLTKRRV